MAPHSCVPAGIFSIVTDHTLSPAVASPLVPSSYIGTVSQLVAAPLYSTATLACDLSSTVNTIEPAAEAV